MKKKRLLFVIDSLVAAGAERSLVTLLSMLDYEKYEVDLQLFGYGGEFEQFLPKEVNLLPPLRYNEFLCKSLADKIGSFKFRFFLTWLVSSIRLRIGRHNNREIARILWSSCRKCYVVNSKNYDVAIAYAQGIPTFYVADVILSDKKLAWVNVDYNLSGFDRKFQRPRYSKIDTIVAVSESSMNSFIEGMPYFSNKIRIVHDIISCEFITKMSQISPVIKYKEDVHNIITVARLIKWQKGYDIALEVCRILRDRGISFNWYIIGKGPYREDMEKYISKYRLDDKITFLNTTPNPYPYIKNSTIYVQTSRHEGYGLSIAEARILNIPVVTTAFNGVYNQMIPEKNGIVVPIDAKAVADAIEDLLNHPEKRSKISEFQRNEKKGNSEELQKFYSLIND